MMPCFMRWKDEEWAANFDYEAEVKRACEWEKYKFCGEAEETFDSSKMKRMDETEIKHDSSYATTMHYKFNEYIYENYDHCWDEVGKMFMNETVYNREICLCVDQAKDCTRDSFSYHIESTCEDIKNEDPELEYYLYGDPMTTTVFDILMAVNPQCEAHFPPEPIIFQCSIKKVFGHLEGSV